jgi:hypothetical protein
MKRAASSFVFLIACSSFGLGCGMLMPPGGAGSPEGSPASARSASVVPKESQDLLRKSEKEAYARADEATDEEIDRLEKDALKAVKLALGQQASSPGMPPPESSSTVLESLKGSKIKVRLESVLDADGNAVNDNFIQLKDSFTDRVIQLQRKITEGKASKSEMKEIQDGAKYAMKLNDLRSQVLAVSLQVMMANDRVQTAALQTMLRASSMVRSRKQMEMDLNADDYAVIRRGLERQKRVEAIAATTLAMMGAYQAVINDSGDPKALDVIASATLKAFPVKAEVTDDDAKKYVGALGTNVQKVKAKYEAGMRKVHGDKKYERNYKAGIDGMFAQAENAQNAKSASQIASETQTRFREDVIKCKRGEDPGPGSMVGAGCKGIYRAAQTGDTSELLPGTKKVFEETGGAAGGGAAGQVVGGKEGAALAGVQAAANGDVDGALDAAGKLFPGDSTIGASLQGIAALKKGDAKGVINAALSFVPVPGLKDAFGLASKLLFKG